MPKVSVIIPTFNGERYISDTIESVLMQRYQDLEIVVIDDGSTDQTKERIKSFGHKITCLFKENGGPGSARNMGIRHSEGRYIAFLDHDDLWLPEKLELQVKILEDNPELGLVYSDAYFLGLNHSCRQTYFQNVKPYSGYVFDKLFMKNFIPNLTVLTKKECFNRLGILDQSGRMLTTDDYNMWLRIAANYPVDYCDKPLAKFRIHHENLSHNLENFCLDILAALKEICKRYPDRVQALGYLRNRRFAELHYKLGKHYLLNKNLIGAEKELVASIKKDPLFFKSYVIFITYLTLKGLKPILGESFAIQKINSVLNKQLNKRERRNRVLND